MEQGTKLTPRDFGQELKRFLRAHDIRVSDAAAHIGYSPRHLNRYFNGEADITLNAVRKLEGLADVADGPLSALYDRVEWNMIDRHPPASTSISSIRVSDQRASRPAPSAITDAVVREVDGLEHLEPATLGEQDSLSCVAHDTDAFVAESRASRQHRSRWMLASTIALLVVAGTVLAIVSNTSTRTNPVRHGVVWRAPTHAGKGVTLVVDSRSAIGAHTRADVGHPLQLTTGPYATCDNCLIATTERHTGQTYQHAVCETASDWETNGNLSSPGIKHNPGLAHGNRWYGIRQPNGTLGFVNEVWISARQRNHINLPPCPRPQTTPSSS